MSDQLVSIPLPDSVKVPLPHNQSGKNTGEGPTKSEIEIPLPPDQKSGYEWIETSKSKSADGSHKSKKEKKKSKKKSKDKDKDGHKKHKHKHRDRDKNREDSSQSSCDTNASKNTNIESLKDIPVPKQTPASSGVCVNSSDRNPSVHCMKDVKTSDLQNPLPSTTSEKVKHIMTPSLDSLASIPIPDESTAVMKKCASSDSVASIPIPDETSISVKKNLGRGTVTPIIPSSIPMPSLGKKNNTESPHPSSISIGPALPPVPPPMPPAANSSQSSLQATLRESMLREAANLSGEMPQSIVDDLFKDFLATKMKQIESEYKQKTDDKEKVKETGGDVASSVEEMNKLLDEELNSLSQKGTGSKENTSSHKQDTSQNSAAAKVRKSKWDVKTSNEATKIDDMESDSKEKNLSIERETEAVDSSKSKTSVQLGAKTFGKLQMAVKISKTSVDLISSGQPQEKGKKKALEEGEVTTSGCEDDSDTDNDDEDDSDDDGNDDPSETGSLSDSDKDSKSKSKKKKKKKNKKKKKKKKHKASKEKNKDSSSEDKGKRKHSSHKSKSRSRSRSPKRRKNSHSPERRRSRSRERHSRSSKYMYDAYEYRDKVRDKYHDRDRERGRTSDRDRNRDRRHSRSRSRSRSKSRERPFRVNDLRLKIDKAKLREIAIKNAVAMAKSGQMPSVDLASVKAGGKSINELTDFCKRISSKGGPRRVSTSSEEENEHKSDDDEGFIHHPFKVKDTGNSIIMNIRDSKPLPVMTPVEKIQEQAKLRIQFPVSSGSTHRLKESDWVPVEKTTSTTTTKAVPAVTVTAGDTPTTTSIATTSQATNAAPVAPMPVDVPPNPVAPEDKVFPDIPTQTMDIGSIISERLSAFKKLKENPNDMEAMTKIAKAQEKASLWAQSKNLPGKFLGSTGVQILSQEELMGPDKRRQAWAKKDQFVRAAPVNSGIGMALLQKMGWKAGEGLGKNNEGTLEPLALDFKTDRRGLTSTGENSKKVSNVGMPKDLSGKHPVSALVELCNRRRWGAPDFQLVHESGPDHKKNFLFKVIVNRTEYQPSVASNNKKLAKAAAATICLQNLGLVPRNKPT